MQFFDNQSEQPSEQLAALHHAALIIDGHADTPQRLLDEGYDLAAPLGDGNLNFETAAAGNLGAQFFAIWVQPTLYEDHYARRALELIDSVYRQAEKHADRMMLATSAKGILRARKENKLAVLLGIEGGHAIEESLALLRLYYRLGARYMTLTWANSNSWADSSGDENDPAMPHPADGLSAFGVEVVQEMNRLGMMVDISHVSDKTFWRTLAVSRVPVFASHSCARALCDAPRNLTDDMLCAVAKRGGLVMVNFYSAFVSQSYRDALFQQAPEAAAAVAALKAYDANEGRQTSHHAVEALQRSYADRIPRPPLRALIDHIDHIARVAGVDHVGIGSDFDGVSGQLPLGLNSPADLPKITAALVARGYTLEDCHKILGGNFLRYFRAVEANATGRQTAPEQLD